MPTREAVLGALGGGSDYPAAARRLGISPGLAYLIATGFPADGSDVVTAEEQDRPAVLPGSTQHLSHPPHHSPDARELVRDWLQNRAQADAQMLNALLDRNALPGPIEDEDTTTDLISVLVRQHDQVVALVKQLSTIPGRSKGGSEAQASERESLVDLVGKMLAGHETAEEEYLWPHVRRVLTEGDAVASSGLAQEQEATETLLALSKADAQTEEFDDLVEKLMTQLHRHVAFEDRLFSDLREAMPEDERAKVGKQLLGAQKHAPTRPHPRAPRHPGPAVRAAAKSAAPLDRARDAAGRPADRQGRPEPGSEL